MTIAPEVLANRRIKPGRAPRLPRAAIGRPRLTNHLHGAMGAGLTVVQAPAGFGKTTLVSQFAEEVDYRTGWATLDESCIAPEHLAERLVAAMAPEEGYPALYAAGSFNELKTYVARAARASLETSELPLLVIVDEAQELKPSQEALDLLDWFLQAAPDGIEIIVVAREAVPLPEADRRLAGGECEYIGQDALAMTIEEVEALAEATDCDVDPATIYARSAGWPVGAMAIARGNSASDGGGEGFRGSAWERYLSREIFESIPEHVRAALPRLSVPEVFDEALAGEVVGEETAASLFEWIRGNEFVVVPQSDGTARINPMVRQFLLDQLRSERPAEYHETAITIVRWLEERQRLVCALELARNAGPGTILPPLVRRYADAFLVEGLYGLLQRSVSAIPADVRDGDVYFDAVLARALAHTGQPEEAHVLADRVLGRPEIDEATRAHGLLARQRAYRLQSKTQDFKRCVDDLVELGIEHGAIGVEIALAKAYVQIETRESPSEIERLLTEAIDQSEREGATSQTLLASATLGQALLLRGEAPQAVTRLSDAARGWRRIGGSAQMSWILNNLGMSHLIAGDFESAHAALIEAREEGAICENTRMRAYAIASLGDAALAMGRFQEARRHYEETIALCSAEVLDESLIALSLSGLSGAMLGLGDVSEADYFIKRSLLVAELGGQPYDIGVCQMQDGVVRSASGDHAGAAAACREAIGTLERADAAAMLRLARYRLGMSLFRARNRNAARQALREMHEGTTDAWMYAALTPGLREDTMFAQWAASRPEAPASFVRLVERHVVAAATDEEEPASRFPKVSASSLGTLRVTVDGKEVADEQWASLRAKELFYLFLANRDGLRKEAAVERLYPELSSEKCNSAFHSNVYRIRKALYKESIIKRNGEWVLNPDAEFEWDVAEFEDSMVRAQALPAGSDERANLLRKALNLYNGPFAEGFYSEWADSLRWRLEEQVQQAMSVLAGYYAGRSQFELAAECMERLLERNRYNEEAAFQLAAYRAAGGQPAVALSVIDDYRSLYNDELGETLPARFRQLRNQIAAGA